MTCQLICCKQLRYILCLYVSVILIYPIDVHYADKVGQTHKSIGYIMITKYTCNIIIQLSK